MSIASEITRIKTNISNAYDEIKTKGGTLPANENSANLATAISTIPTGGGTGIPREITAGGVFQVPQTDYDFTLPNTATDLGNYALYSAFYNSNDTSLNKKIKKVDLSSLTAISGSHALDQAFNNSSVTEIDLSNVESISGQSALYRMAQYAYYLTKIDFSNLKTISANYALNEAFYSCSALTGTVSFPELTTISGDNALKQCFYQAHVSSLSFPKLTSVTSSSSSYAPLDSIAGGSYLQSISFASLETVGNNGLYRVCYSCNGLTSALFPSLKYLSGNSCAAYAFQGCRNLTSIDLSSLISINGSYYAAECMFRECYNLTSVNLANLQEINGYYAAPYMFSGCTSLQTISFPALETISGTNAMNNMFLGCSSLAEIHFAAANQAAIEASGDYDNKWGAPASCTIYFDL